jgi:hypothetical protein
MIRYKHDSLGEMGLDPSIGRLLDLILDTFVATDDDGRRCEPCINTGASGGIPLRYGGDGNTKTLFGIRYVPELAMLRSKKYA